MQDLEKKIERAGANIEAIQEEEQGSNSEAELRRLMQLKKNYQTELEKKELSELEETRKKNKRKSRPRKTKALRDRKRKKCNRRKT